MGPITNALTFWDLWKILTGTQDMAARMTVVALIIFATLGVTWLTRGGVSLLKGWFHPEPRDQQDEITRAESVPSKGDETSGLDVGPKAVAHLRGVSLTYQSDDIVVSCSLALFALADVKESPTELLLKTADSTGREVCALKLPREPLLVASGNWTFVHYWASLTFEHRASILRAIRSTMRALPMKGAVFVKMMVDLPLGHARENYASSGVQYDVPSHLGGRMTVIAQIENWDGVPMKWAFDDLWSLSEEDKAKLREDQPDVWESFVQEVGRRGLSYSWRTEATRDVVMPEGTIRQFTYRELASLAPEQQEQLFDAHPDLAEWWNRETSDRMGPPGRQGAPWPEDLDDSSWTYREVSGRTWRYRDICSLPIPERQKLKTEKLDVWNAYWNEALRRSQYVLPDGRRLTQSEISAMGTMELVQLGGADPDAIDWYMKGREF